MTIPVSPGIFAHYKRIGPALWVFLWLINATAEEYEAEGRWGKVRPCTLGDIAYGIRGLEKTVVSQHLGTLERQGYIRVNRDGATLHIEVAKAKKFVPPETIGEEVRALVRRYREMFLPTDNDYKLLGLLRKKYGHEEVLAVLEEVYLVELRGELTKAPLYVLSAFLAKRYPDKLKPKTPDMATLHRRQMREVFGREVGESRSRAKRSRRDDDRQGSLFGGTS